jgi:hypothetical protein
MNFIPRDNIDTSIWDILENFKHKNKENEKLKLGDYVLVQILNKRINSRDTQIKTICKLLDFANEDQIIKYFKNGNDDFINIDTNEEDQSNFII